MIFALVATYLANYFTRCNIHRITKRTNPWLYDNLIGTQLGWSRRNSISINPSSSDTRYAVLSKVTVTGPLQIILYDNHYFHTEGQEVILNCYLV